MSEPATPVRRVRVIDFYAAKRKDERWATASAEQLGRVLEGSLAPPSRDR